MEIVYGVELPGRLCPITSPCCATMALILPGTAAEVLTDEFATFSRATKSQLAMAEANPDRTSLRYPQHFHVDVRTRRNFRPLGRSASASAKFSPKPAASPSLCRWVLSTRTPCCSSKVWRVLALRWLSISKFMPWLVSCLRAQSRHPGFLGEVESRCRNFACMLAPMITGAR